MNPEPMTRTVNCEICREPMTVDRCFLFGRELFTAAKLLCDLCGAEHERATAQKRADDEWALRKQRIPHSYRAADGVHPNHQIDGWKLSSYPCGLGIVGPSGTGKSWSLAALICRLRMPFVWVSSVELKDIATLAAAGVSDVVRETNRLRWEAACNTPVLALDDLHQATISQAWTSRLFDLLETRTNADLPTLWTSQLAPVAFGDLIHAHDPARGEAIARRLTDKTLIIE